MYFLSLVLQAIILPGAVAGVFLIIAELLRRRGAAAAAVACAEILAVGVGWLAGFVAVEGRPPFPPTESVYRLPYLVLAAIMVNLFDALRRRPAWVRCGMHGLFLLAALFLLLHPQMQHRWEASEAAAWLAGLGVLTLSVWQTWDGASEPARATALPLGLIAVVIGMMIGHFLWGPATGRTSPEGTKR
jgi:hypothetical protein